MSRKLTSSVVLAMLLLSSLHAATVAAVPVDDRDTETLTRFCDGEASSEVVFEMAGTECLCNASLPNHAFVRSATVNITLSPTPDDSSAPWDPELDVAMDGMLDWAFQSSRGGPVGRQDAFEDGTTSLRANLRPGEELTGLVPMPGWSNVREAYVDVVGHPIPHWLVQYNLTPESDSLGESAPEVIAHGDSMWALWSSADPNITTEGDHDVVVRRFDGEEWGPIVELSDPADRSSESHCRLESFQGGLYAIWRRGEASAAPGSHNELVYRVFDGTDWSPIEVLSGPASRGINTFEQVTVFEDRLYVVWKTTDPVVADIYPNGEDVDIVYRSFDGATWGPIVELTAPNNTKSDWSVDALAFGGRLFVVWDTWEPNVTGRWGNKDIVLRTFDGTTWSELEVLSPPLDEWRPYWQSKDSLPVLSTYTNPSTGVEELFVYWTRQDTILGEEGDGNIVVYRRYLDGEWGEMETLSEPVSGDPVDQTFPSFLEHDGLLYAIWVRGTNSTEYKDGNITRITTAGDIVVRTYDGESWSPIRELTPLSHVYDNASHPTLCSFDGKLYAAWKCTNPVPGGESWEVVIRPFDIEPVKLWSRFGDLPSDKWGPDVVSSGVRRIHFDPEVLTEALHDPGQWIFHQDTFGNYYRWLKLTAQVDKPAYVVMKNLTILYDYTFTVNFTKTAAGLVAEKRDNSAVDTPVEWTFEVATERAGTIALSDLCIDYYLDYPPFLVEDVPTAEAEEDSGGGYLLDLEDFFGDDWDDGNLTFEIYKVLQVDPGDQPTFSLEARSRLVMSAPPPDWNGEVVLVVRAYDLTDLYHNDSNEFTIRITPVNDPPVLAHVEDQVLEVDVFFDTLLDASDIDDPRDSLRFSDDSDLVEVDPVTGTLTITFRPFHENPHFFNVTVTDPHGASDTQEVRYNYTHHRVTVRSEDWCPIALVLLVLLVLAMVTLERIRRRRKLTEAEQIWDEEAAHEERRRRGRLRPGSPG